jgi:plastocyanin
MKLAGTFVCSVVAVFSFAAPAQAGFGPIGVGDDFFDPDTTTEASLGGGQFRWEWNDDVNSEHNVRQDNKLFNSGAPTDDPNARFPANGDNLELPAGKYHYYCTVHGDETGGMDANIWITPIVNLSDTEAQIQWAFDNPIRVGDRWHVQYRRGTSGAWKTWKKKTATLAAAFGAGDKPVNFNPDKTYQVRAKTMLASNPDKQSKFSPPITFGGIMR